MEADVSSALQAFWEHAEHGADEKTLRSAVDAVKAAFEAVPQEEVASALALLCDEARGCRRCFAAAAHR